jgi:hypothetical protein
MLLNELPSNPFVGLRPFESHESLLFFGRADQSVALMQRLHETRFLSVVGSSGCGKSSLIRAGLIPKLKGGFLVGDRDRWLIAVMKPGETPLQNLAIAFLEACGKPPDATAILEFIAAVRASGASAVADQIIAALKPDTNFLLVIDQFEEIFRFGLQTGKAEERDEAFDFISIMLNLTERRDLPIYVVMTMRSDFLGDCDAFYGLPEAMNRSQYLVPRQTRQQRQQAIEGPILLFGKKIAPRLLDRLLNDMGDLSDQLPVMQHAMMRTWEKWSESNSEFIDIEHYEAVGTINNALSLDADEALKGISSEDERLTEHLFQALTDTDAQNRQIRRPANLSEVAAITGASGEKILELVKRFSTGGRSFLNTYPDKVKGDWLIDISHESLIRQWETLKRWVEKEAVSRTIYLRIADAAVRHKSHQAGLWRNPDLRQALDWRAANTPNMAWAQRHHPKSYDDATFDRAMAFIDASKKRRRLSSAFISAVVVMALGGISIFAYQAQAQRRLAQERQLAEQQREQENQLNAQRLEQTIQLAEERSAQERALAAEKAYQEKRLYEEREQQEKRLNEQRVRQARDAERKIAAAKQFEAEQRILAVRAEQAKTQGALDDARKNLDKYLAEQERREETQYENAQLRLEVADLTVGPPVPVTDPEGFALRKQLLGQVKFKVQPDGSIEFEDGWDEKNIEVVEIPELKGVSLLSGSGPSFSGKVKFYKPAIPQLIAAFQEIRERRLLDRIISWDGSFVPRTLRGSTRTLSSHSLGLAFDINSAFNYIGKEPAAAGQRGSVVELVSIFKKYGFHWGGENNRKEGNHFEVVRLIDLQR